jgi:hypothetical protein
MAVSVPFTQRAALAGEPVARKSEAVAKAAPRAML